MMIKPADVLTTILLVGCTACGDDATSGGGGAGAGGAGVAGAPQGGSGGEAVVSCDPYYTFTLSDCTGACVPFGEEGNVFCTNACESNEDCLGNSQCASPGTAQSLCLPPCEPVCPSEAFCDTETYPGFCVPI